MRVVLLILVIITCFAGQAFAQAAPGRGAFNNDFKEQQEKLNQQLKQLEQLENQQKEQMAEEKAKDKPAQVVADNDRAKAQAEQIAENKANKFTGYKQGAFSEAENCIPCKIITTVINISNNLGEKIYNQVQNGVLALMGVALALWIAINVAKLLFPFTPLAQAAEINNYIANRVIIVMLVATFLLNFNNFWSYLYAPMVGTGMKYAHSVMEETTKLIQADNNLLQETAACRQTFNDAMGAAGDAASKQMNERMQCLIKGMTKMVGIGLDLSFAAISVNSFDFLQFAKFFSNIIPAVLLIWTYGMIMLFFSFRILDVVIRWGIMVILSPLLVGAFALPSSRRFTIAGVNSILNGAFEIIIIAVIMGLAAVSMSTITFDGGGSVTDLAILKAELQNAGQNIGVTKPLFWQLWFVGLITDASISNARKLSRLFADTEQGLDMELSALARDVGERLKGLAQAAGKGFNKGFFN